MDSMSSRFQSSAASNMQSQMGSVKSQKELNAKAIELREAMLDGVDALAYNDAATVTTDEGFIAGSYSGELSQTTDEMTSDGGEQVESARQHREQLRAQMRRIEQARRPTAEAEDASNEANRDREARRRISLWERFGDSVPLVIGLPAGPATFVSLVVVQSARL